MEKLWIPKASESKEVRSKSNAHCVIQGIVHFEFLPQGQTVNPTVAKKILWCLLRSMHDKRQSLWEAHAWVLCHNYTPAHTALSIC